MTNEELQKIKEHWKNEHFEWSLEHDGEWCRRCEQSAATITEIKHRDYCVAGHMSALLAHCKELAAEVERLKGDSDMIVALSEFEFGKPYLELTTKLKEHPEKYDRPCLCELCRSCGS